jgi:16S rRNA G966 N2-methylase RsmD
MLASSSNVAKRDFLFRFLPSTTRTNLLLDDESLYSTTDQLTAEKITKDILKFVPKTATVTDATACIGGTAYALSKEFAQVNAIELDENRYTFLQHNMKTLNVTNVQSYHCDAIHACINLTQQVIFIDPPWGGPEYKNQTTVSLYLSGFPLASVCESFHKYTNFIVVKVPTNFDESSFVNKTAKFMHLVHRNISLRKMHLLIFSTFI